MDISTLQRIIINALEDVKAQEIMVFDTAHLTPMFERIVVASGTSNRQTRALALSVRDSVKTAGGCIISTEGLETGEWILVDCDDIVVHIMQPMIRDYYKLEQMWGEKPLPLVEKKRGRSKKEAAVDEDDDAQADGVEAIKVATSKVTAKKTTAKKVAAKKVAAKKVVAKKAATKVAVKKLARPAKKSPATKRVSKASAPKK